MDGRRTTDLGTATHQLPCGFRRFTARVQRRYLSVAPASGTAKHHFGDLIHNKYQFTAAAASTRICSFEAERRVHLLLIRLDRFTSASPGHAEPRTFSPLCRRSVSERNRLDCISVPTTGRRGKQLAGNFLNPRVGGVGVHLGPARYQNKWTVATSLSLDQGCST